MAGLGFTLFHRFEDVERAFSEPPAVSYYAVVERMRQAVLQRRSGLAEHPDVVTYANACYWAIRKLEYSFAARSVARLGNEGPLRILDIGCGVVPFCNWLALIGHQVVAVDPSSDVIDLLRDENANGFYGSTVEYQVAHAEDLPFADAQFDLISCISVLEHTPPGNDRLALRQMGRVLKPGGALIISFDVAPPLPTLSGEQPWPADRRRFAQPFSPGVVQRLFRAISGTFEVDDNALAPELLDLDWDSVHAFWRAAREHDVRNDALRDYVAMGGVLRRRASVPPIDVTEITAAYREGQAALEERVGFFQLHAQQRLELVQRLHREAQLLRAQLDERERSVAELQAAADERLRLIQALEAARA